MDALVKQIEQLIQTGQTEEALSLLAQIHPDSALLLQSRFNQVKRQFGMGLLEHEAWSRTLAQITHAALELLRTQPSPLPPTPAPVATTATVGSATNGRGSRVFISYNHQDEATALQMRDKLKQNGHTVIIDKDDLRGGGSIMQFIQNGIKEADVVLSIVSGESLQSGWVGLESIAAMYAVWLADKKFVPVRLDNVLFDSKFQIQALRGIKEKMEEMDRDIQEIRSLGSDARDLEDDRKRLFDLQKDFSTILQKLKSVRLVDLSAPNFEQGFREVLDALAAA
jgi:hypothetical protein